MTPDYIVCLEDGKKFKSLKRHLRTQYNMTPEQYREKWGLPADYPMVAPNYAKARSELAKDHGPRPAAPQGCGQNGCSLGQGLFAGEARQKAGAVGLPKTPRAAAATSYVEGWCWAPHSSLI